MLSWEKPLVKPMAPRSLFHIIESRVHLASFRSIILQSLLSNLYNQKYEKYYLIISIRSHCHKWPWRDWQPLYRIGCEVLVFFCVGTRDLRVASYWIDTLVLKTEGNTYATLLHHPFLFKGKPTWCSRGSKKDFWRRCRGGLRTSQDIPSTHHKLYPLHYIICHLPLV